MRHKLLLLSGSTVFGLLMLELLLHWVMPPVLPGMATADTPNAALYSWALPPNSWMSEDDPDTGRVSYFRTNAQGWKDREHTLAKPEPTFRIVVLGDSYTYGVVPMDQQYTTRVEAMLRERGWPQCEVISIGVSGWGTDQALGGAGLGRIAVSARPSDLPVLQQRPIGEPLPRAWDAASDAVPPRQALPLRTAARRRPAEGGRGREAAKAVVRPTHSPR